MNQVATQQQRLQMDSVGVTTGATGSKIAPQNLGEVVKFAEVMARADIALPKHLRGNTGACMAVALQAMEWNLSPFAVASKSYQVNGAIAYEAQLIAAVVNTRSGIKGRLKYRYDGEGSTLTCTVSGLLDGEECTYTSPQMGSITTKNSPLWKSDPQQQLGYFAARSWARRHCPEVILGVYDRDEAEEFRGPENAKNITPAFDPLSDEPITTQTSTSEREGLDPSYVQSETDATLQGEVIDAETNSNTDDTSPASSVDADTAVSASEAVDETPTPSTASTDHHAWLLNIARLLWAATKPNGDVDVFNTQRKGANEQYPMADDCPELIQGKAKAVSKYCMQVINNEIEQGDGLAMIAGVVGVDQDDILQQAEAL
jgi:hypothetical protein